MIKGRRTGTLTAGVTLVVFGILFILHSFQPALNYKFIFSLWPVILILLGIEIIVSYFARKEEMIRYDGGAILLMLVLALFAMGMGGAQFFIENARVLGGHLYVV